MTRFATRFWFVLLFAGLFCGLGSDDNLRTALSNLNRMRQYPREQGYPVLTPSEEGQDAQGYYWAYTQEKNSLTVYRFDGLEFDDMSRAYQDETGDTLIGFTVSDKQPWFFSRTHVVTWNGQGFDRVGLPQGETAKFPVFPPQNSEIPRPERNQIVAICRYGILTTDGRVGDYRKVQGLGQWQVHDAVIDKDKRLWLALLAREDEKDARVEVDSRLANRLGYIEGRKLVMVNIFPERMSSDQTQSQESVGLLRIDKEGRAWCSTSIGVMRLDPEPRTLALSAFPVLPDDWGIICDSEGNIWVGTKDPGGFSMYLTGTDNQGEIGLIMQYRYPIPKSIFVQLDIDTTSRIPSVGYYIVSSIDEAVYAFFNMNTHEWITVRQNERFTANLYNPGGYRLTSGDNGCLQITNLDTTTQSSPLILPQSDPLTDAVDIGHSLWLTYPDKSVLCNLANPIDTVVDAKPVSADKIRWIQVSGGLSVRNSGEGDYRQCHVFDGKAMTPASQAYEAKVGLREFIAEDRDGRLWFETTDAKIVHLSKGRWASPKVHQAKLPFTPLGYRYYRDGKRFLIVTDQGLYYPDNGNLVMSKYPYREKEKRYVIDPIVPVDNDRALLVITEKPDIVNPGFYSASGDKSVTLKRQTLVLEYRTGRVLHTFDHGLPEGIIRLPQGQLCYKPTQNRLIFNRTGKIGFFVLSNAPKPFSLIDIGAGTEVTLPGSPAFSDDPLVYQPDNRDAWLRNGREVLHFMKGAFHVYTGEHGLPVTPLDGFCRDAVGDLWGYNSTTLCKYIPGLDRFVSYGHSDGLPQGIDKVFADAKGGLWLVVDDRLHHFTEPNYRGALDISAIRIDNRRVFPDQGITLHHTDRSIDIDFRVVTLDFPERCLYSYQLVGYSEKWSPLSTRRSVHFENLPPGKYVLKVRAWLANGLETKPRSVGFRVLPPWYFTWVAQILWGLLLVGALWLAYHLRMRSLVRSREGLERTVALRTIELREERDKMLESIEYAALLQQSTLPREEEMLRLFPKHFVFWRPRDIVGGDFYWVHARKDMIMLAVIDCTGHGVPGALLAMTANSLLDSLVQVRNITSPNKVIEALHEEVTRTFRQETDGGRQNGMDIGIVTWDMSNGMIRFAGAMHTLFLIRNGHHTAIEKYRGDRVSIGSRKWGAHRQIGLQEFAVNPGDRLYLYSDGIVDLPVFIHRKDDSNSTTNWILENQGYVGSDVRRVRLSTARWEQILLGLQSVEINAQTLALRSRIDHLRIDPKTQDYFDQRDDVTVVGIEIV